MMRVRLLLVFTLVILTGCDTFLPDGLIPTNNIPETETPVLQTPGITPTLVETPTPSGPTELTLWVPPLFNPESGNRAGNLIKSRLLEFSNLNPEILIEVRTKDVEGPGGLLDTLSTAAAAAQTALPDLMILPHDYLEAAVTEGLLKPFDNLSSALDDPNWYNFGREMSQVQGKIFGLPIAADAMVQVYNPESVEIPLIDSTTTLAASNPLIFPAADPQSLFTLALYLAEGGTLLDDQNHAYLDSDKLTSVLRFYQQANNTGSMPYWLTGFQQDQQSWEAFRENRGDQVITWLSRYLSNTATSEIENPLSLAPVPTISGAPYTLGGGWLWALTSPEPAHHPASVRLAEFLTESDFLSELTASMKILPSRPSALRNWTQELSPRMDPDIIDNMDSIARSMHPYPSKTLLTTLSRALEKATVDILKGQSTPEEAARQAVEELE